MIYRDDLQVGFRQYVTFGTRVIFQLWPSVSSRMHPFFSCAPILRRINTYSCIFHIRSPKFQKYCECGDIFNTYHLEKGCTFLNKYFHTFYQYIKDNDLLLLECTSFHEELGWEPALTLTKDIYSSPYAYLF